MTDRAPTTLDRLLDDIPTGSAPIAELLVTGQRIKRRRRNWVAGFAAATIVIAVSGVAAIGALSANPVPVAPTAPTTAPEDPSSPEVSVEGGVPPELATEFAGLRGSIALWDARTEVLTYVPAKGYSGSCPPLAQLLVKDDNSLLIDITQGSAVPGQRCTGDSGPYSIIVNGLGESPTSALAREGRTVTGVTVLIRTASWSPDPGERLEVGESGIVSLWLHCGLRDITLDGTVWTTTSRGNGSPPVGWPEFLTGTVIRTSEDKVVFTSSRIENQEIVFHPQAQQVRSVCY